MHDRITNLIYALFTWFGRVGGLRFVITSAGLLLLIVPLMAWETSSSLQWIALQILGWGWLMQYVKRGHDFGAPAWLSLLVFFASVFLIPALFWAVMPGDDSHNEYGPRGSGASKV